MSNKEKYGIAVLITAILLFQIWVADAETAAAQSKQNQSKIKNLTPQALLALVTMVTNDTARKTMQLSPLSKQSAEETKTVASSDLSYKQGQADTTAAKKTKAFSQAQKEEAFIWYKPWTWFTR